MFKLLSPAGLFFIGIGLLVYSYHLAGDAVSQLSPLHEWSVIGSFVFGVVGFVMLLDLATRQPSPNEKDEDGFRDEEDD